MDCVCTVILWLVQFPPLSLYWQSLLLCNCIITNLQVYCLLCVIAYDLLLYCHCHFYWIHLYYCLLLLLLLLLYLGTIPASVGSMVNLNYLELYANSLIGTIPSSVTLLTKLTDLRLFSNKLTGIVSALCYCLWSDSLVYLDIYFNRTEQ